MLEEVRAVIFQITTYILDFRIFIFFFLGSFISVQIIEQSEYSNILAIHRTSIWEYITDGNVNVVLMI